MSLWILGLAAFGGGLVASLLGWADSHEPFDGKKFTKSVLLALLGGLGFAVSYNLAGAEATSKDIILAALGGAGWDNLSNRFLGAVKKGDNG